MKKLSPIGKILLGMTLGILSIPFCIGTVFIACKIAGVAEARAASLFFGTILWLTLSLGFTYRVVILAERGQKPRKEARGFEVVQNQAER